MRTLSPCHKAASADPRPALCPPARPPAGVVLSAEEVCRLQAPTTPYRLRMAQCGYGTGLMSAFLLADLQLVLAGGSLFLVDPSGGWEGGRWVGGRADGWMNGWVVGRAGGWAGGRPGGWVGGRVGDGPETFVIPRTHGLAAAMLLKTLRVGRCGLGRCLGGLSQGVKGGRQALGPMMRGRLLRTQAPTCPHLEPPPPAPAHEAPPPSRPPSAPA